jgi:putative RecB family exonuclease
MSGLFRLSHSKIQAFDRCTKQYWFRYLSGFEKPPEVITEAGLVGNGVHRAMKALADSNDSEAAGILLDTYLRMPAHEPIAGPGTPGYQTAFDLFERGCEAHAAMGSEAHWGESETWVPSHSQGISVFAKIDRIDRFADGRWQIIDWKTGNWDWDETTDAQLDIGHLAARVVRSLPRDATVSAIGWNLKTGNRRERTLDREAARGTMLLMAGIARRIQAATEFEPTPGPFCTFCDWRPRCPEGNTTWETSDLFEPEGTEPPEVPEAP